VTDQESSPDASTSEDSGDDSDVGFSSPSPKHARTETKPCTMIISDDDDEDHGCKPAVDLPADDEHVPEMVNNESDPGLRPTTDAMKASESLEALVGAPHPMTLSLSPPPMPMGNNELDPSLRPTIDAVPTAIQTPVKRKRGRPRKVRSETETMSESGNYTSVSESASDSRVGQDADVLMSDGATTVKASESSEALVEAPHPMTLSLSPPPMPIGRVPQPAGVLLLPLYSSTPTEPGEQSSLMVVQPHQLANFPFAEADAYLPPVLMPGQPLVCPAVSQPLLQPEVYTLPSMTSSQTKPASSD